MSYRPRKVEKMALFIVSTAMLAVAIVLFLSGRFTILRWVCLVGAYVGYVGVFVADWQDELRLTRHLNNERALSHERAKIVGEFVHGTRTGGDEDGR